MEYLGGGSLADRVNGVPQDPRWAAALVRGLADAMAVVHGERVIHRDLKPRNVVFTADGTPKITDYGLAKLLDEESSHTLSGQSPGTPSYMAPEQAGAKSHLIGPATDVYAARGGPVRAPHGPPAIPGSNRPRYARTRALPAAGFAAGIAAQAVPGPRDGGPEMPGERPRTTLPVGDGTRRRPRPLARWQGDPGAASGHAPAVLAVVLATPGPHGVPRLRRAADDPHDHWAHDRLLGRGRPASSGRRPLRGGAGDDRGPPRCYGPD